VLSGVPDRCRDVIGVFGGDDEVRPMDCGRVEAGKLAVPAAMAGNQQLIADEALLSCHAASLWTAGLLSHPSFEGFIGVIRW